MTLRDRLRVLADEDVRVPAHVDAAVMAAWDHANIGRDDQRGRRRGFPPAWSWVPWLAVCAVIVSVAVLPSGGSASRHRPYTLRTADRSQNPPHAAHPPDLVQQELVLIPEFDRAMPLTLMRVRMTRREFSKLGIPISNPQSEGLVDVEVLVGEDGVARSIRRAVAVEWAGTEP